MHLGALDFDTHAGLGIPQFPANTFTVSRDCDVGVVCFVNFRQVKLLTASQNTYSFNSRLLFSELSRPNSGELRFSFYISNIQRSFVAYQNTLRSQFFWSHIAKKPTLTHSISNLLSSVIKQTRQLNFCFKNQLY